MKSTKFYTVLALVVVALFSFTKASFGQAPPLGSASSFAVFTAAGAFSNDGATVVTGDIGTNVGAFTGFPPGVVNGSIHVADPVSAQAAADVELAPLLGVEMNELARVVGRHLAQDLPAGRILHLLGDFVAGLQQHFRRFQPPVGAGDDFLRRSRHEGIIAEPRL